jgi:predicted RNA-binding Zn ribbon-like protein
VNLDIFWLRDETLEDSAALPDLDILALEIMEDLQAALEQFKAIAHDLEVVPRHSVDRASLQIEDDAANLASGEVKLLTGIDYRGRIIMCGHGACTSMFIGGSV